MQKVAREFDNRYRLGPDMLYDNLQKPLDRGTVEELSPRASVDDPGRRYYRLTRLGRCPSATEIAVLGGVVREAGLHLKAHPESAL